MIPVASPRAALISAALALLPPPDLSVSAWAVEYRVLSREDSAEPGRWSTDSRPFQTEIMDACSTPRIQFVSVVGCSQWGKTQILNNAIGQRIDVNPGPIMVVSPTVQAAEKWSKTRFMPMVRDCPSLAAKVGDGRTSSNTILEKQFPGGLLVAVGASAPAGLASQPIRDLFMDEVDRIPEDASAGDEGDFEDLAEARTANYEGRRLIYRCSTPTISGRSRIEKSWNESDKRQWFVPCPHCGHSQTMNFKNVVFSDRPEPIYACSGGGCEIREVELRRAVLAGEWRATRSDVRGRAGFMVHGLMVRPMATLVERFLVAKRRGPKPLQSFVNTQLGEWWNPRDGDVVQAQGLAARTEPYEAIPAAVGLLVAAVDIQDDRLEVKILGVGAGEELWVVAREIIPGNLAQAEPWDRLEALLRADYPREDGGTQRIKGAACDIGGHFTKQVYRFARRPRVKGIIYPVKGASKPQNKLAIRSAGRARLWLVDTVAAKDSIFAALKIEDPGPGYIHFPQELGQDYFEQLLSEKQVRKEGRRAYAKVTPDARNEALDLMVYALAAVEIYAPKDLYAMVRRAQTAAGGPGPLVLQDEPIEEVPEEVSEPEQVAAPPAPSAPRLAVRVIKRAQAQPAEPLRTATPAPAPVLIKQGGNGSGAW